MSYSNEFGGVLEPPVTPVGRDELAMKRHRLYSELLMAAQAAVEHRVRFDPFGPDVANEGLIFNFLHTKWMIFLFFKLHAESFTPSVEFN